MESIFQDVLDSQMDQAALAEANDKTIPKGTYKLEITKKDLESAGDTSPWPGRMIVRCQADAFAKEEDGTWKRKGKVFFDVSPVVFRNVKTNQLDSPSRLWANLVSIVGKGSSNREAYEYLGQYPLTGTVSRPFKTVDGKYVNPATASDENDLLGQGAEPKNFVQSLRVFNG